MVSAPTPPTVEHVLVVPRAAFFDGAWPQGFVPVGEADVADLLRRFAAAARFMDRPTAETSPEWKQLIPYCVLRRPDEVLCVQRKKAQVENRLHGMLSIGLGGHINPHPDRSMGDPESFAAALWQELEEELVIHKDHGPPRMVGLLNDDSNAVGQVHVGLVYVMDIPPRSTTPVENVRVREISKMTGGFRSLVELQPLWQDPGRFESWSRLLLNAGIAGAIEARGQRKRTDHVREERNHG
jgi:predicted NUDIX family phosphoesterase